MFTVVISEQEHLDSIREYGKFLQPFLDNPEIAFCQWRPEGITLPEAVPDLYATVSRHDTWRLIVLCDEEGLRQKNPFDLVGHSDPLRTEEMDDAAYFALRRQARLAAYEQAAQKPLVRLMTWLCRQPLVSEGTEETQALDPEFAEYVAQARKKEALRQQICGDYTPEIALPAEILCLAKRCYDQEHYDIRNAWTAHEDTQYSRFYDWNLYFDKMRYLIFDILPKQHRNYTVDYIRFLYSLMILAGNETPMAALSPNRVYVLLCRNDEDALRALIGRFDYKLASTQVKLEEEIAKLEKEEKPRLSDRDAQEIFCSHVTIPVTTVKDFDYSPLFIPKEGLGLATDCPEDEQGKWDQGYQSSRRTLTRYLKLPQRALRKTTAELHRINKADLDCASQLNEFQVEDVAEYTAEEEMKMVTTKTLDIQKAERFTKTMEDGNKKVQAVIDRRMTRKWTVILGLVALACYVLGFVPMFLDNAQAENGTVFSLVFFAVGAVVMAATAYFALWFLRRPLRRAYSDYNGDMKGIVDEVEGALKQYSKYLSHACNVMRGNSVLNYCRETEDPNNAKIRVLKKHSVDVLRVRAEMQDIFVSFLPTAQQEPDPEQAYVYDYFRPVDYGYPIPFAADRKRSIEFLQKGNLVEVPVDFIKYMHIRREELYD